MQLRVAVGPRFKVADHNLRLELADQGEVRSDILREPRRAMQQIAQHRFPETHAVLFVNHVEAVNAMHFGKMFGEKIGGTPGCHDLNFMPFTKKMLEHHARPNRMPHPLANDPVQDSHGLLLYTPMRRVWVETLPAEDFASPRILDILERYGLSPIFAVTPENIEVARRSMETLARRGLVYSLWPMVNDRDGRWLSVHTHETFLAFAGLVSSTFPEGAELVLDLEPPFRKTSAWLRRGAAEGDTQWRTSHTVLAEFVAREVERGREIACTTLPFCFFEPDHAKRLSRRLGLPFFEIPWSRVNYMAYASIMEGWSLRSLRRQDVLGLLLHANQNLRERESLSLGLVATGAFGNEPIYRSTRELEEEIALLGQQDDLSLFDLGGALRREGNWLDLFTRTVLASPPSPERETKRIQLLRYMVRSAFETKRRLRR